MTYYNDSQIIDIVNNFAFLKTAFFHILVEKLTFDGYVDAKSLLKQDKWVNYYSNTPIEDEVKRLISKYHSTQFLFGYYKKYYKAANEFLTLVIKNKATEIGNVKGFNREDANDIIMHFLLNYINLTYSKNVLIKSDSYICNNNTSIVIADSLNKYIEILVNLKISSLSSVFFRGQGNSNFLLLPSVYRSKKWNNEESSIYKSILRACPKSFLGLNSHIDRLCEMQHYKVPTRLLDISKNALVALYFACAEKPLQNDNGEVIIFSVEKRKIKNGQSDAVSILSCLPLFDNKDQREISEKIKPYLKQAIDDEKIKLFNGHNIIQKLLHEIKSEKPAFDDKIDPRDLRSSIFTMPALLNDRMIKQSGSFIIAGLYNYNERKMLSNELNGYRYINDTDKLILIINSEDKSSILTQLALCDINQATLFPEIDMVADYIRNN